MPARDVWRRLMLFNSLEFAVFFAIVYTLYRLLSFRGQNAMLLVAGYVFYGLWDVRFLYLVAFSTVVDFNVGLMLGKGRVPLHARVVSSIFLVAAAFGALCINWAAIGVHLSPFSVAVDWPTLWRFHGIGGPTLIGSALIVALANAVHGPIAAMPEAARKRLMVIVTVVVNLGFLGIFKYANFFIDSASSLLGSMGLNSASFHLNVILPVGISFYTFQSLSYTLDAYRGRVRPTEHFWTFALFVAYFPPMVAGPIERGRHLLPQLERPRKVRLEQSTYGVMLVLVGLFKKIAIADGLAPAVSAVFDSPGNSSFTDVCIGTALFAVQIFCDFSGYSDIAIGVSKLFGIELMRNFDLPYFSRNPSEFWRRWHISLSSWLRDYLYISLGGNRKGEGRTYVNLMITMVLGGLWHGAAWNFILWGAFQGGGLCVHRLFQGDRKHKPLPSSREAIAGTPMLDDPSVPPRRPLWQHVARFVRTPLLIAAFLIFVCYGWLLFRADSMDEIVRFTRTLLGFGPHGLPSKLPTPSIAAVAGVAVLFVLQLAEYLDGRRDAIRHWPAFVQGSAYATMFVLLLMGMSNAPVQFIYFQF